MSILTVCQRRWFTKFLTKTSRSPIHVRTKRRPILELLEDRTLPSATLPNELLVQFRPGVDDAARAAVRGAAQASLADAMHTLAMTDANQGVMERIVVPEGVSMESALQLLRSNPNVLYAEPNALLQSGVISNDPYYTTTSRLWGMYSDDSPTAIGPAGTTNQYGSQAEEAWNNGNIGSRSVVVGIIDEGFQFTHPDLAANVWTNPFDPVDGVDNDGNGYIDDVHGWDFFSNDNSIYDGTTDDHGTHVAGTIGATGGNALGVAGVNWEVTMISTKFLGPNGGYTSGAIQALDYLTDLKVRHGINIVATNNSWGGGGFSQGLLDAITRAANQGILFIAAAGNGGADGIGDNNNTVANYPSNYSTTAGAGYEAVIAVASITSTGARSSFSNYGSTTVDIGAPGSSINSTLPTDGYGSYSGTSMATPHVTGAVALYAAVHPEASANDIRAALLSSATPTASLSGITVTGGRLNIAAALGAVTLPSLTIDNVTVTEGDSGTTNADFTVTLSAPSLQTVTVNFATADGTASSSSDYGAVSGTVTFTPGQTTQTITVAVNGDTSSEATETFFVNLSAASNATIADSQGQGTIQNDDLPALSINDMSTQEGRRGQKTLQFTVSLSAAATQTVTVHYATADGSATLADGDYKSASGNLTFSVGQSSKTVNVTIYGDRNVEPDETFVVNLTNAVNAAVADGQGTGTIINDDGGGGGFAVSGAALASAAGELSVLSLDINSVLADVTELNVAPGRKNDVIFKLESAEASLVKSDLKAAQKQLTATSALAGLTTSDQPDESAMDVLFADLEKVLARLPAGSKA
jgi:subtilisin family serine protease